MTSPGSIDEKKTRGRNTRSSKLDAYIEGDEDETETRQNNHCNMCIDSVINWAWWGIKRSLTGLMILTILESIARRNNSVFLPSTGLTKIYIWLSWGFWQIGNLLARLSDLPYWINELFGEDLKRILIPCWNIFWSWLELINGWFNYWVFDSTYTSWQVGLIISIGFICSIISVQLFSSRRKIIFRSL